MRKLPTVRVEPLLLTLGAITVSAWCAIASLPHVMMVPGAGNPQGMEGMPMSSSQLSSWTIAGGWALMMAAMMPLLINAALEHVRHRSFAHRRLRSMLLFVVGYSLVWMLGSLLLYRVAAWLSQFESVGIALGSAGTIALVWQLSPGKQHSLNRCHSQPALAAFGWAADYSVLRYGVTNGLGCFSACSGLMLLALSAGAAHILVMLAVTLFIIAERFEPPQTPTWRWRLPHKWLRIALAQSRMRLAAR